MFGKYTDYILTQGRAHKNHVISPVSLDRFLHLCMFQYDTSNETLKPMTHLNIIWHNFQINWYTLCLMQCSKPFALVFGAFIPVSLGVGSGEFSLSVKNIKENYYKDH